MSKENEKIQNANQELQDNETVKTTVKKRKTKEEYDFVEEIKKDMVEIKIPLDQLNKHLKTEEVYINGYRWTIEKGKTVQVPRAVKEVLENAGII